MQKRGLDLPGTNALENRPLVTLGKFLDISLMSYRDIPVGFTELYSDITLTVDDWYDLIKTFNTLPPTVQYSFVYGE